MSKTIYLPISPNYVGSWGLWEAVREIYQNALDQGESTMSRSSIDYTPSTGCITVISGGVLPLSSLVLGNSTKASDPEQRGKFGEGYKLALLVLMRLGRHVEVRTGTERWTTTVEMHPDLGTEVLTINVLEDQEDLFNVVFEISGVTPAEWETITWNILDNNHGTILDDKRYEGRIYVGGLYVCTVEEFECGYSFKPEELPLDRDRQMVSTFDLQCLTAKAWAARHASSAEFSRAVSMVEKNTRDVAYIASYATSSSPIVIQANATFVAEHGEGAVPVNTQEEIERATAAGTKWVLVTSLLKNLLSKTRSFFIPSAKRPHERLEDLLAQNYFDDKVKAELTDIIRVLKGV